jgi:predicted Holliday junction resolvase-like endonuclease
MIFRIILTAIIFIFITRFILRFVVPIFQVTRMTQSKLREMQEQMQNMQRQEHAKAKTHNTVKEGDYIDYEEIK